MATTTKLPTGILVRDSSNNKIYFIDNGTKRHITNETALAGGAFVDIDPSHLADVPDGKAIDTKPSFDWKNQEEINKLLADTKINWQQPSGYDPSIPITPTPTTPTPITPTPTPTPTTPTPTPTTPTPTAPIEPSTESIKIPEPPSNLNLSGTNSASDVKRIFKTFFGREPTGGHVRHGIYDGEIGAWMRPKTGQQLYDYAKDNYVDQNKSRINDLWKKYNIPGEPTEEDYNYWLDPSKKNDLGNLDTNLQDRISTTPEPTPTPTGDKTTEGQEEIKIGKSAVNHLYQLYLGRDANQNELDMYMNHPDDAVLRKDLEFARKNEAEKVKKEEDATQAVADEEARVIEEQKTIDQERQQKLIDQEKAQVEQEAQTGEDISGQNKEAFWTGDYSLVKFSSDPGPGDTSTVWLVDKKTKEMRPFLSKEAMENFFENPDEVYDKIITMPASDLDEDGMLAGFQLLDESMGIDVDGILKETDINPATTGLRYGKDVNEDIEMLAYQGLDGLISLIKQNSDSGIASTFIDEIKGDKNLLGMYIGAMAYGDYTLQDIYKDIKRRELVKGGDTEMEGLKLINPEMIRGDYLATNEGAMAHTQPVLTVPPMIGNLDTSMLDFKIFDIPQEAFQTLVPVLDVTSPEFKEEMEKIQSAFHDIMMQQLEAKTEQDKSMADYNYERFREQVKEMYGWELSDNAVKGWDQLQQIGQGFGKRGLSGSGLHEEAEDKMLQDVRRADERMRTQQRTVEEDKMIEKYRTSGSPDDIQKLIDEDKAKGLGRDDWRATQWGLVPSQEVVDWFAAENLKELYPNLSDEEINNYRTSILDEGGNYRSTLYRNYVADRLGIERSKKGFQVDTLLDKRLSEEERAYREFTKPDSMFQRSTGEAASKISPSDTRYWSEKTTGTEPLSATKGEEPREPTGAYDALRNKVQESLRQKEQQREYQPKEYIAPTGKAIAGLDAAGKAASKISESTTISDGTTIAPKTDTAWETFKTSKPDTDWSGYTAIPSTDYDTDEKKKTWQNVQDPGSGTLYGYK